MSGAHEPSIAAVVCTCNRGARFVGAVESILAGTLQPSEVIVIDQSRDSGALHAGHRFEAVAGFRFCRVGTTGLAKARNAGIDLTRGEIVAFMDDDCEASPDWLAGIVEGFEFDRRIGIVHGNVLAGPHDRTLGFIPSYVREAPMLAISMREKHLAEGMGASMAVRRSTWIAVGGFDELLGAGGLFRSAEDVDFTMRALEKGIAVYETSQGHVVHSGFRSWEEGETLIHDYLYGIGATYAKHLKCRQTSALQPMGRLVWRWAAGAPVVNLGRTPSRLLRLRGFARGFFAAAAQPVDPRSTCFAVGAASG